MSSPHPLPPIPDRSGVKSTTDRLKHGGRRRRWPAGVSVSVSIIGITVAIVASNTLVAQTRMLIAISGFVVVIVVGTAMLFVQRVLDVGVARLSGTPLISSFDFIDKLTFLILIAASVANGVVIALQVARQ